MNEIKAEGRIVYRIEGTWRTGWRPSEPIEARVAEVSPNKKMLKLDPDKGSSGWVAVNTIEIMDVLEATPVIYKCTQCRDEKPLAGMCMSCVLGEIAREAGKLENTLRERFDGALSKHQQRTEELIAAHRAAIDQRVDNLRDQVDRNTGGT